MLLEIKKEKDKYVLINPPQKAGSHFWVEIEANKIISIPRDTKKTDSDIYKAVKVMASKYPDNEFLKISLELTPNNYSSAEELKNESLLNEALADKYGI
jgi:hypothetical protein